MRSVAQFLSYMNETDFLYVVLRNWEGLPHDIRVGPHTDLDLLVYDYNHFSELFQGKVTPVYPLPRVQHEVSIGNSFILADIRSVDDGYYPPDFSWAILRSRVWNKLGFWTPDPSLHRIALSYHAVHHKGFIAPEYRRWLGNSKLENLVKALKDSHVGWTPPDDPTVGRYYSYNKGATSIVSKNDQSIKKRQYRFKEHDLIDNEHKILSTISDTHFPKVIGMKDNEVEIEHCGEPLSPENIPPNWEGQLYDIIRSLALFNILHRDIRIENLMVKDGVIKLIDFGWAGKLNHPDRVKFPDLLGFPNKAPWGFDDSYSMGKVIKQIHARLEDAEAEKIQNKR